MVLKHFPNDLLAFRLRLRLSRVEVAALLGHKSTKGISKLELGRSLPSFTNALKLGVIYRVPVDFLFSQLYQELRAEIRQREAGAKQEVQPELPLSTEHL
jgi:transcriptional regulator with XRE-family HTH domain